MGGNSGSGCSVEGKSVLFGPSGRVDHPTEREVPYDFIETKKEQKIKVFREKPDGWYDKCFDVEKCSFADGYLFICECNNSDRRTEERYSIVKNDTCESVRSDFIVINGGFFLDRLVEKMRNRGRT